MIYHFLLPLVGRYSQTVYRYARAEIYVFRSVFVIEQAALSLYPNSWRRAKLALLESIVHRFFYEVDTKAGPLSLSLRQRAEAWKIMYDELKEECAMLSAPSANPKALARPPYFYEGMHDNRELGGTAKGRRRGGRFVLP